MTNCQVLELDFSEIQFEDLSDEMASAVQGGTGDKDKDNGNGGLSFLDVFDPFFNFLEGFGEIENLNDLQELKADFIRELDALF